MPFDGTTLRLHTSKVTQTLIEGKKRVEHGWCQRAISRGSQVCAVGALVVVSSDSNAYFEAMRYLNKAINNEGLTTWCGLGIWNDARGRTKEEVLAAYDRAIELSTHATVEHLGGSLG